MKRLILAVLALMAAARLSAEIRLPAVLGSNMVLQRNTEVNFWGEASPHSKVRVTTSWNGRSYEAPLRRCGQMVAEDCHGRGRRPLHDPRERRRGASP